LWVEGTDVVLEEQVGFGLGQDVGQEVV